MLVQGVKKGYLKFLLHSACPLGPRQLRSKKSTMLFILVFNKQYILRVSFFWILVQHHSTIILSIILRFFHILVTQNQPHTFSISSSCKYFLSFFLHDVEKCELNRLFSLTFVKKNYTLHTQKFWVSLVKKDRKRLSKFQYKKKLYSISNDHISNCPYPSNSVCGCKNCAIKGLKISVTYFRRVKNSEYKWDLNYFCEKNLSLKNRRSVTSIAKIH